VQSGFTEAFGKSTYGYVTSLLLTYSYYTMLALRIKKKMLLNYSFCRIFYFRRDPKFVAQKIFVIIIMYFVGARSSFMNIERIRGRHCCGL